MNADELPSTAVYVAHNKGCYDYPHYSIVLDLPPRRRTIFLRDGKYSYRFPRTLVVLYVVFLDGTYRLDHLRVFYVRHRRPIRFDRGVFEAYCYSNLGFHSNIGKTGLVCMGDVVIEPRRRLRTLCDSAVANLFGSTWGDDRWSMRLLRFVSFPAKRLKFDARRLQFSHNIEEWIRPDEPKEPKTKTFSLNRIFAELCAVFLIMVLLLLTLSYFNA